MQLQTYDFTVQAGGGGRRLDAPGSFFYYLSGNAGGADSTITLMGLNSGLRVLLKPGQAAWVKDGEKPETSWQIGNYANAAQITGLVLVGEGGFTDNRISGDVGVIDTAKNTVLAGQAFSIASAVVAVAAQAPFAQVWNPPGSGKNLIVEQFTVSTTTAANAMRFGQNTAALANAGVAISSKTSSVGASVAQSRYANGAALPGGYTENYYMNISPNTPQQMLLKKPFVIKPGTGFVVGMNLVNSDLSFAIDWTEESV